MAAYRPEIDGMRTIAVMGVVIYHAGFELFGAKLLPGGFLGVDVFFVISGYLIGAIVLKEISEGRFSLWTFYERRARRILPALYLVLAVSLVAGWVTLLHGPMLELAESALSTLGFGSNVYFWRMGGYGAAANELRPLLHTWSLAIEEQFYLLMPLIALALYRWVPRWASGMAITVFCVSLIGAEMLSRLKPEASFYLLPSRAWELLAGVMLAGLELRGLRKPRGDWMTAAGIMLMIVPMFFVDVTSVHPGLLTLLPVGGACLVIWGGGYGGSATAILSSRVFVGIGLISYSLYLWHQPIFAFARLSQVQALGSGTKVALIAFSLLLGWLSWRFVERPFRARGVFSRQLIWALSILGAVAIGTPGVLVMMNKGYPERFPAILQSADPAQEWWRLEKDSGPCFYFACTFDLDGDAGPWILVGDSHAGAIAPALKEGLQGVASTLEVLTWGGCPVIFDVEYVVKPDDGRTCLDRNAELRATLQRRVPSTIVFAARMPLWIDGTRFDNGEGGVELGDVQLLVPVDYEGDRVLAVEQAVTRTIEEIMAMGHRVILVYPIPEAGWDVPQMVRLLLPDDRANAEQWLKGDGGSTSLDRYINRAVTSFAAYDAVPDDPKLHRVYPQEVLCVANTKRCLTHSESEFYYSDDDHLSLAGARLVVGQILKAQF